ncbi:hypothetical protein BJX99DRAFT_272610 [Aspergillus californicus]
MSANSTPSRRPQACERCWKRKQKCDRLVPRCTTCVEASATCNPRPVRVEISPEDNIGLSHAALPGYVESLKQTIDELESGQRRKRRRLESHPNSENAASVSVENHDGLDSSVRVAMGEIGFLSRSAMAEPRDDRGGLPRHLGMAQMMQAMFSLSGACPSQSQSTDADAPGWRLLGLADPIQALNHELAEPFLQHFLRHIGIFYLHFGGAELKEQYGTIFAVGDGARGDMGNCEREFDVYLAIATGMLLSPQSGRFELLSQGLHAAAVKLLPRILQSGSCTKLIHCLLLLTVYSMLSPNGGSTWHLLGLAMRKCISFRFHKDEGPDSSLSVEESTRRMYLFWSVYIIDRTLCTVMDRPFGIQDEDISLSMPKQEALDETGAHNFECHLILHAKLVSSIRDSKNESLVFHYQNACFWEDPPQAVQHFLDTNEVARHHIQCLSSRALLQVMKLHGAPTCGNPNTSCEEMIDHMYRALDQGSFAGSYIDGYDIFAAGLTSFCSQDRALTKPNVLNKCIVLLTAIGERFSSFKVFRRLLLAMSDMRVGRKSDDVPPSRKRTVYLLDTLHPDAVQHAKTLFHVVLPEDKESKSWREHASAVVIRNSYITADDITRAPNLVAIGKHGVGVDKIDQAACMERGIRILNTPGANARDVAELVVALTMTVARSIRSITTRQMIAAVPKESCAGLTLHKKTIGVIGMGNIGRTVAEIFHRGFDAQLIAYDAFIPSNAWSHLPHHRAHSLQEILDQADVITLHIPLTDDTRDLISYAELRQMKPNAILINAARGGIVNEDDLTRVLSEGHLWGVGLDCHEQEPPSVERYGKLWENLNVVSTPHIGAATNTAQRASSMAAVDNLYEYLFVCLCPCNTRAVPLHTLYIALHTICNEQGPPISTPKATVGQVFPSFRCRYNSRFGHPLCIYNEDGAQAGSIDTASWVLDIPVGGNDQVVGALESLEVAPGQQGRDSLRNRTGPSRKMSDGGDAEPPRHSVSWPVQRTHPTTMGLITDTRRALRESPKGIFNVYLFGVTWVFALAGVAKGFDEGFTKGWIVSIATAGAVFGCLGSLPISDRVGRRWTLRMGTLVYIAGVLGQGLCNGSLGGLYAARIVSGMGIGVTTIVPPVYISEIAPKAIRGLLTLQYAACQQLGVVLGFFINYGVTKQYAGTDSQWMLPTLLQLLPAAIWGIGTFMCPESPRWLLSVGHREESISTLSQLRHLPIGHPVLTAEIDGMDSQILHEHESVASASQWQLLKETLVPVENRRRFFLLFMATLFSQWSGANAITQYSPTIFGYLGIVGDEATFLATGIYGVVKFVSTLVFAVLIVDFVGRRRSLLTGIGLQIVTLVFVGAYLGATNGMTADDIKASPNTERASTAAIVAIYLHAVAWSIGWFSVPYLIGPEIFPTRIRSLNMSSSMALHWAFYFGCSKAMPSLLAATHRWGAFAFFASICVLGLSYVFFAMPDTTGRSLEALDRLFQRPWYTMYKVAYATQDELQIESSGKDASNKEGEQTRVEHLESA